MNPNPRVALITATKGRHTHLERNIRFFLDQDYTNSVHIVFNNSPVTQILSRDVDPARTILINQHLDSTTNQPYTTLGAIYNDAILHIPADVEVVGFMDDDDVFLPNHITEGVKGLIRGGKTAYKPQRSFFRSGGTVSLVENTLEPSIFIKREHIDKYKFSLETSAQHLQWVNPLVYNNEIYVDPEGTPTLIYCWGDNLPTFKTSGNAGHPENFNNYADFSQDSGDGIITPISKDEAKIYYKTI